MKERADYRPDHQDRHGEECDQQSGPFFVDGQCSEIVMELEEHGNIAISQEDYGIESQKILGDELFGFGGGMQVGATSDGRGPPYVRWNAPEGRLKVAR